MLRPHQQEFFNYVEQILSGSPIKEIFIYAKPGAGKSLIPPISSKLIVNKKRKGLWIVPRSALAKQGERGFNGDLFDTEGKTIRIADNSGDAFRGCDYAIATYQAIIKCPEKWIEYSKTYELIVFLDEFDSLTDESAWTVPIKEMWKNAFLRIAATGTINRSDLGKISFIPYCGPEIDFTNTDHRKWIVYDTEQALSDGSILPYDVHLIGGSGSYIDLSQIQRSFDKFTGKQDQLITGYKTEYAHQVFGIALKHWEEYSSNHPWSKFLVISHNIEIANSYYSWFKERGYNFGIATSEDNTQSDDAIDRLKMPNNFPRAYHGLVSVSKIYKGLDIPDATHEIFLSGIRGIAYVDQAIGRIQRRFPSKEKGFLFAPDDPKMREVLKLLGSGTILKAIGEPRKQGSPSEETDGPVRKIQALESCANIQEFLPSPTMDSEVKTQSDTEKELRKNINQIINSYLAKQNPGNMHIKQKIIWLKIKSLVNKGYGPAGLVKKELKEMTIPELKKVLSHVVGLYS